MNLSNPSNFIDKPTPALQNQSETQDNIRRTLNYKDYYKWMVDQLTPRISSLAVALLGNPTQKRPAEWRWGKKGEVVIYISGDKMGRFCDFESGVSGDALELVKYKTGYQGKELSNWVKSFIGYQPKTITQKEKEIWTPVTPVPLEALEGDITKGLIESFNRKGFTEYGRYCYRDLEGNVLGFVVRFEQDKDKLTLPLTYCINKRGNKSWWWKGFPVPRLPYGAELLKGSTNTVLVVEGEKKCEAARSIFPDMTVISWIAGTGSVHLTDWFAIAGRDIVLWPDNDEPGLKCMTKLKKILEDAGANSIRIVSLPTDTPHGWDLADKFPDGWDKAYREKLISEAA
ncbi:MAG: conjugal transfer protein TraA [Candidatus Paracaedibacter sp.]